VLLRLNVSTRKWHADVDDPWLDLLSPSVSRADYCAQLVRTYGIVAPFESACRYTPRLERLGELFQLNRAGLIAQDLLALGLSPLQVAMLPQCETITTFRSVPEALGWLYVVERTTLLQDGIRRHLLAHLPELELSCAYLSTYDGRISEHWALFGRWLDTIGENVQAADEIVAATHAGFATVREWFHTIRADARSA
jgi:heme oxygenase